MVIVWMKFLRLTILKTERWSYRMTHTLTKFLSRKHLFCFQLYFGFWKTKEGGFVKKYIFPLGRLNQIESSRYSKSPSKYTSSYYTTVKFR